MLNIKRIGLCLLLVSNSITLQADEDDERYNRISLTASATQEVENDLLSATLFAQHEGQNPKVLQERVNRSISQAVAEAKQQPAIKVRTLDYRTTPIYRKQKIDGWRVRQLIHLQSRETTALSTLVGQLQKELAVESINYNLSPEARQAAENSLMAEAIAAFQKRATLIAEQFSGSGEYRLVNVAINTPGRIQPQMRVQSLEMSRSSAPAIEAGSQRITLIVSGMIELKD